MAEVKVEVMVELVEVVDAVEDEADVMSVEDIVEFMEVDEDVIIVEFIEEVIVEFVKVMAEDELNKTILELMLLVELVLMLVLLMLGELLLLADARPMAKADMIKMMFEFMLLTTKCSTYCLFILDHNI